MVATISFVNSKHSGSQADYYLKPTQPEWERNRDLEYQLQPVPDYPGTVPIFSRSMQPQLIQGFGLDMAAMQREPHPQLRNLFAGLRADGEPTGKRQMAAYVRHDGKEFSQKTYFDITISNDISVGIALANSETPAGRALLLSASLEANEWAMGRLAERIGYTRLGAGGKLLVPVQPLVVTFPHFATRPTQTGFVAPNLHFHNIAFSAAPTDTGRMAAIDMMRFGKGNLIQAKMDYHDRFAENVNRLGVATHRLPIGSTVLSDVPEHAREFFSQRKDEILSRARENAEKRGYNFDELSAKEQQRYKQTATFQTRGRYEDGVANTQLWRWHCVRLDYSARDLPGLAMRGLNAFVESHTEQRASRSLYDDYRQTYQQTRQAAERHSLKPRARRQIVAVTLALQIATAKLKPQPQQQPKKPDLYQEFSDLAKSYTEHKTVIRQRLLGRKLLPSLAPLLMELQRVQSPIAPRQYDHESLGHYLAVKHRLPVSFGPEIAQSGRDILAGGGRQTLQSATMSLAMRVTEDAGTNSPAALNTAELRAERALKDAVDFYDKISVGRSHTMVGGNTNPKAPMVFAKSYGDAALISDATKLPVMVTYTRDNTESAMANWRQAQPDRQFMAMGNRRDAVELAGLKDRFGAAPAMPPQNQSGANSWLEYTKNYGTEAAASGMRHAYRQEFKQNQTMQQKMSVG